MQTGSSPRNGNLIILSAPSGAGKTTLCQALRQHFPQLQYSVSHTTRAPRAGEKEGKDYYFVSLDEFKKKIGENAWAEWAEVHGNYYGTSADFIDAMLDRGETVLLDIDVQGARQIRRRYPDSITIFIRPPSVEVLKERLTARGTDTVVSIQRRIDNAAAELETSSEYHHVIVNDRLPAAIQELIAIVEHYQNNG